MNIGNCEDCNWFEERSGFCRESPPIPQSVKLDNGRVVMKSIFPKISNPKIDWCSKWEYGEDDDSING
jgi:hypothetical protein